VVVTAVDVASGELVRFGNTASLQHSRGQFANTERLTLDHILASCSLPPGFPETAINGRSYWDGGLRSNTPLSEAINGLEAFEPDNASIKREAGFADDTRTTARGRAHPERFGETHESIAVLMGAGRVSMRNRRHWSGADNVQNAGGIGKGHQTNSGFSARRTTRRFVRNALRLKWCKPLRREVVYCQSGNVVNLPQMSKLQKQTRKRLFKSPQ
jgi:predicted acylesterase/phospholipase RssA